VIRHVELRAGYRDSVRLMQLSQALRELPGIAQALVAMATDVNLDLAAGMDFPVPDGARPDEMLVALAGADDAAVTGALARLATDLDAPEPAAATGGATDAPSPRTVTSALRSLGADIALVSTPGRYAFLDAMDALDAGANVMVFSDNMPVAQEVALKEAAAQRGLLMLGPDCGTALVGGVGLGFANLVRPGPVGLVAASGTGAQQVMCLLDEAGVGISHCLGVGGRDMSAEVGGRGTLAALSTLDSDPATELILVLSKPPDPAVAERVRAHAATLGTPVQVALLGSGGPDLAGTARLLLDRLVLDGLGGSRPPDRWRRWLPDPPAAAAVPATAAAPAAPAAAPRPGGAIVALYCGGTLRDEAAALLDPARPSRDARQPADILLDLGDDEYTRGRPHPMIDGTLRLERLAAASADPGCSVILLDVILGYAADPDPAASLAPAVAAARAAGKVVVVSLIGTAGDRQGRDRQAAALRDAGAAVFAANADAVRYAIGARGRTARDGTPAPRDGMAAAQGGTAEGGTAEGGTAASQDGTAEGGAW
jgi:FdrA protein